jgi:type III secretion protein J
MGSASRLTGCLALAGALLFAGCKKEIYHGLTENEANEVLVVLKSANIDAEKVPEAAGKKGVTFAIAVDEALAVESMRVMLDNNLPRQEKTGLKETFAQPSMIPTETEEKSRLLAALQGDLENSLRQIDGVVDARVHLVLPEMSPIEGRDVTPARAAVLVKYREKARATETEADAKRELAEWRKIVAEMNDDLKRLKKLWTEDLPKILTDDQRQLLTLDTYLNQKQSADENAKEAREALRRLNESATKRLGFQNVLASLPRLKDLEGLIAKTAQVQLESVGFASASVRSLVANATPRLLEDDVAVTFTKVVPPPLPAKVALPKKDWKADYFIYAAGAAAALALLMIVMTLWATSLKGKLAAAEKKLKSGGAGAPAAMASSTGGTPAPG